MLKRMNGILICVIGCLLLHSSAAAQEQLPQPDPEFKGNIGQTYKDSTPSYPPPLKAPERAPNVLIILLDDVGFGMCSTFGGPVPRNLSCNFLSFVWFFAARSGSIEKVASSAGGVPRGSEMGASDAAVVVDRRSEELRRFAA